MMPAMNRVRATRTNNRAVLFLDCSCVARKASGRRLGPIGPRQCRVLMLAARCGQGLLLLRFGYDGPIRPRADVAANEPKLRIFGPPHELSRLAAHRLVEHRDQFGLLQAGEGARESGIMSRHE